MKYCSTRKKKTLLMYRICVAKGPGEIWQHLTDDWITKNDIIRLFECLELSESTAFYQKRCDCIVDLCILLKKRLSYFKRCKGMVPLFWRSPTELYLIITFDFIYQRHYHRVMEFISFTTAISAETSRSRSWKRCTFL